MFARGEASGAGAGSHGFEVSPKSAFVGAGRWLELAQRQPERIVQSAVGVVVEVGPLPGSSLASSMSSLARIDPRIDPRQNFGTFTKTAKGVYGGVRQPER